MTNDIYIHHDESDEFIGRLIKSFDLSFEELGIRNGMTFQELIDNITIKLGKQPSTDCSTQIVFYKLRQILTKDFGISKNKITPQALIDDLFPKRTRKPDFIRLGKLLNVEINYYQPPGWIVLTMGLSLLTGIILLFYYPFYGATIVIFSLIIFTIVIKTNRGLHMKTFGELVDRLTRDNIIKLQAEKNSINPKDIRMTVIKLIDDLHGLDKLEVNPAQKIVFG